MVEVGVEKADEFLTSFEMHRKVFNLKGWAGRRILGFWRLLQRTTMDDFEFLPHIVINLFGSWNLEFFWMQ